MTPLNKLYTLSGWFAGLCLVAIAVLVLVQIVARQFGAMVPAADEFAAYAMAASGFLALPYALQRGAHIRVELVARLLPPALRRALDILACLIGLGIAVYLAYYSARFVLESYQFHDVSSGLLPIPMWLPQLPMVLGTAIFAVAMFERLVLVCLGRPCERSNGETVLSE